MTRMLRIVAVALIVMGSVAMPNQARGQSAADSAAIRATALDYIEGWYAGDAARMERALHPDLAKRIVGVDERFKRSTLNHQSAMTLVQKTRAGGGKDTPVAEQRKEVRILDIFGNTASVRIDASTWIDYLHVVKWNARWVIINVLWENRPQ